MKVLFITIENHPGTLGGIQTFGRNLKKIYGKDLIFLTNKFDIKKLYNVDDVIEIFSSNKILRIINKICKNIFRKYLIVKKIKEIKPDICILSSYKELEFVKNINTKVIFVQHTLAERYLFHSENIGFYRGLGSRIPDYIICSSNKDKELFKKELFGKKIKFEFIRFPNDLEILDGKKKKIKKLIILSRLENSAKRLDLAIKVMKKLPDFTLEIYGDGPAKEVYLEIIDKYGLSNVKLMPSTNKVKEVLDQAGIYVMTSDFENYGIVNIEAMRRGLPIVLRNTFNAAEDIVQDNGILLSKEWDEEKFVEAVKKIYDNYEEYSENSKKLGLRYNLEVIKKEWDKILKEI